jgi:hypothetical protein
MHRIIVTGWRGATVEQHNRLLIATFEPLRIIHGHQVLLRHGRCPHGGIDLLVDLLAREWDWQVEQYPAEVRGSRVLGPERNRRMCAVQPRADELFAFPGPGSRGTWNCVQEAAKLGITCHIYPLGGLL